ncbi:MAG: response regulator [Alphaproteobacteria bacterium]|nr:response regulator [Alphaproteobacteria bacterium]
MNDPVSPEPTLPDPATGKRVLVTDDAVTIRLYYRQVLEAAGFFVDEAVNGVEAIERALCIPFDLLIVDINMSLMDGLRLLRLVRQDTALQSIPALVISTETRENAQRVAYEAGANFFMVKPVAPDALIRVVRFMTGIENR